MSLASVSITLDADNLPTNFQVVGFEFTEQLSAPFELDITVHTDDANFEPGSLLGEPVTALIARGSLSRDVHGIVVSVVEGPRPTANSMSIALRVVPAWCALGQRKTSRIFEGASVPEIVVAVAEETLSAFGRTLDRSKLTQTYDPLEYAVQIDETDQAFLERILAEHGIGYVFDHSGATETLTLFDDVHAFDPLESVGNTRGILPVTGEEEPGVAGTEEAFSFELVSRIRPTGASVQVFDWHNPGSITRLDQTAASTYADISRPVDGASVAPERLMLERDEPAATLGERNAALAVDRAQGFADIRRELQRRDATTGRGRASAIMLSPTARFTLSDHPLADLDAAYVCVGVTHRWGRIGGEQHPFHNVFEVVPSGVAWRPDRSRPKPRIHGIQTATVVGPANSEIHTDADGRIQVQFHWGDRTTSNAGVSCYLRVVQSLAGNGWGAVFLPRVGMEVVVSFIDGDPDRPVVTGCLYNGTNTPPHELPANKTVSTIKTQSTGQTGGFNELRFEDANGGEEIYVHAQRDLTEDILHDHATTVSNDQTNTVGGNQTEEVTGDQSLTVHGNRSITVDADFSETVTGAEVRVVRKSVTETIDEDETRTIKGGSSLAVTRNVNETVGGKFEQKVTGAHTTTVTGPISATTPNKYSLTASAGITLTTTAGCDIVAPSGLTVTGSGVTLVDNDYFAIAATSGTLNGQATSLVGYSLGGTIAKTDFGVVTTAVNGVNLAANGVDLAAKGVGDEKVGCDLKTAGTSIKNAGTRLLVSAILMML